MKIRIKGNSVRFRLSKSEVEQFAEKGFVEEQTAFVKNTFVYKIRSTKNKELSAEINSCTLTVYVPEQLLSQWASTNMIGLEHYMPVNAHTSLHILVEKDFKCIDANENEDQSDYFDNPVKAC